MTLRDSTDSSGPMADYAKDAESRVPGIYYDIRDAVARALVQLHPEVAREYNTPEKIKELANSIEIHQGDKAGTTTVRINVTSAEAKTIVDALNRENHQETASRDARTIIADYAAWGVTTPLVEIMNTPDITLPDAQLKALIDTVAQKDFIAAKLEDQTNKALLLQDIGVRSVGKPDRVHVQAGTVFDGQGESGRTLILFAPEDARQMEGMLAAAKSRGQNIDVHRIQAIDKISHERVSCLSIANEDVVRLLNMRESDPAKQWPPTAPQQHSEAETPLPSLAAAGVTGGEEVSQIASNAPAGRGDDRSHQV